MATSPLERLETHIKSSRTYSRRRRGSKRSRSEWVSKSAALQFHRCEYAWWASENGQLVRSPLARALIERGARLHEEADGVALEETTERIAASAATDRVLAPVPILAHPKLRIFGAPDAVVELPDGGLASIEYKTHARPRRSDDLELAFYNLVLGRWTGGHVSPVGYVFTISVGGVQEVHERELDESHFDEVRLLVDGVRRGRQSPPSDALCGCDTCRARLSDKRTWRRLEKSELTMLWDLGPASRKALATIGIRTQDELRGADPDEVVEVLRAHRVYRTHKDIAGWTAHMDAYRDGVPRIFGDLEVPDPPYFLLDTEYDTRSVENRVFLVALGTVDERGRYSSQIWRASGDSEEAIALTALREELGGRSNWPIVAWSGEGADRPILAKAAGRLGVRGGAAR